ncbi:MAG: KH domain-containing protein [archaeon]
MPEYNYEIKVPKERVAVLIGKNGEVKKDIEEETQVKIRVDSDEGDVFLRGSDAVKLFLTTEVVKAIGRGFNPDVARLLLKQDYSFELVSLGDMKSKKLMTRLKGRVIGAEGKSRVKIEEYTECHVSVYGKTIGIIGLAEHVDMARHAIESLLKGNTHASVYRWLEGKRRSMKLAEIGDI